MTDDLRGQANRNYRAECWIAAYAAITNRHHGTSAQHRAIEADQALAEFDKRFDYDGFRRKDDGNAS